MPYIKQQSRDVLDPCILNLLNALRELESDDEKNSMSGNLNYVFTKLLATIYGSGNYDDRSDAIKTLECAKIEFYRKYMQQYEDQKEFENGSVDVCLEPIITTTGVVKK
jgi:hypothetical protein